MRTQVVLSLAASILLGAPSANASSWRDLRIDSTSVSTFEESVQKMRSELPYNKAVLFVIVLKDLKTHLAPAEYRQRLDRLTYKQVAHLASPQATAEYLAYYAGRPVGQGIGPGADTGAYTYSGAPAFTGGGSWSGSTVNPGSQNFGGQQ